MYELHVAVSCLENTDTGGNWRVGRHKLVAFLLLF